MKRKNGRNQGEVFTNKNVIHFILDEVGYASKNDLRHMAILEPASGRGAFAKEIVKRLFESSLTYNFSFKDALLKNVQFIELDVSAHAALVGLIDSTIESLTSQKSRFGSKVCLQTDFLTFPFDREFDCIVGNPPYIRHERIPEKNKIFYRTHFKTFKYRADLYVVFYEKSLALLKEKGTLSFICSNRWLTNQYGAGLRELIATEYNLIKLLNIENSSPFDEEVIAYPCISFITKSQNGGSTYFYEDHSKEIDFEHIPFQKVNMPGDASWQNLFLEYDINHNALLGIMEQGFEIGIGVATGADKVFIKSKFQMDGIEKSRLLPLIKAGDLKNNQFQWGGHFVINPYEKGTLCDLDQYPNLKRYLEQNKETLLKRHTAQKSPDKWFKTIDKINPQLQHKPKLLLPDLTGNTLLFIDEGNYYPHHNLYYITCPHLDDLKILACILMSNFVRKQMAKIGIRMHGGLPRFQSQVLRKLKVMNLKFIDHQDKTKLIRAFDQQDLHAMNAVVDAYCTRHGIA